MKPELTQALQRLGDVIRPMKRVIVAYSGGVDSALVMAAAHRELGYESLACIGVSPSLPKRELDAAVELALKLGVNLRQVLTDEHLDPRYLANPSNRCFYCKNTLYDRLRDLAKAENYHAILDGSNASDLDDDRPGMTAAREHGVRSPLLEAGLTKPMVRALARALDLPVWNKPAMACLSSRVPHGTPITPELLAQIEAAEDVLVSLSFTQFRVRHHGELARIELPAEDFSRAITQHEIITQRISKLGYRHVTLDLKGFRRGNSPAIADHEQTAASGSISLSDRILSS